MEIGMEGREALRWCEPVVTAPGMLNEFGLTLGKDIDGCLREVSFQPSALSPQPVSVVGTVARFPRVSGAKPDQTLMLVVSC